MAQATKKSPVPPFSLKVPKTKAKVILALVGHIIGAVRFEFGDVKRIVAYVETTHTNGPSYIPRGIMGIGDGNDLSHATPRILEPMFNKVLEMSPIGPAPKKSVTFQFFDLNPNYPKGAFVFAGWNSSHPCPYWGVDENGLPMALVLHFPGTYFLTDRFQDKVKYSKKESADILQSERMKGYEFKIVVNPDGTFESPKDEHHERRFGLEAIFVVIRSGIKKIVTRLPDKAIVIIQWTHIQDVLATP